MKKYLLIILIILLIPLAGEAVEIGDTIELIATNQQGVPLHRAPFPSIYDYAPDRSRARVIDMAKEGQWLLIELNDSQTGWISSKYVAGRVSSANREQFAGQAVGSAGVAVGTGDTIELQALNQQGVPLHRGPYPSMFGYAPDRSRVRVIDVTKEGQWLLIELDNRQTGWISREYVAGRVSYAGQQQFAGEKVSSTINNKDQSVVITQGDFNKDGYTDLAIGAPYENIGNKTDAGAVNILYGSARGLVKKRAQLLSQATPGIEGEAEKGDRFGYALATADFNNDGYIDLAVGAPYEDIGNKTDAGAVNILYGSANGLTENGNQIFFQDTPGIEGESENGDRFGYVLTTGDFNKDGFADLAVGVPYEDIGNTIDAGAVNILYGSASGLTTAGNQVFSQDTSGVRGESEKGDLFGYVLTTGDFNNDGYADLVVGVPYEDGGTVNILYGSANGLTTPRGHSRDRTRDDWWKRKW